VVNIIPSLSSLRSLSPKCAALILATSGLLTSGSLAAPAGGPPPGKWTLSLNEDFDGTALNTAIWTVGPRWASVINSELQAYVPENVSVANGLCTIKVEKREAHNTDMGGYVIGGQPAAYASSMIQTYKKWSQTYGYFEARIRMATGKGTWPAFWLLPDRGAESPNVYYRTVVGDSVKDGKGEWHYPPMGNEIDVVEYMATWKNPATGLSRSHCGYIWGPSKSGKSSGSYALENNGAGPGQFAYTSPDTQFHTYGVYWGPGQLIFYIDGIPVLKRGDSHSVSVVPEYLLLNCAVSDNDWTGTKVPREDIDAGLPCTMDIDYVRVWTGVPTP